MKKPAPPAVSLPAPSAPPPLAPGLYLVATPIGNLRDISLRALDTLAAADLIACEDTRVTGKLLHAFGIEGRMLSYNDHNAAQRRGPILKALAEGGRVALVSDAGTPLVSDPGYKLVRECLEAGLPVTSLPGANAPLTALQLSGLPSDKFSFIGFLPPKSGARRALLAQWRGSPGTLLMFESGPRLAAALADLAAALGGEREAAVLRELTKLYEESRRGTLAGLAAAYAGEDPPKGEIVIAVAGAQEKEAGEEDISALLQKALETMSVRDAAESVSAATGAPKKTVYQMALGLARR
jgi:16S rRNA (cytidine1402-2'-O)-methyltransferase